MYCLDAGLFFSQSGELRELRGSCPPFEGEERSNPLVLYFSIRFIVASGSKPHTANCQNFWVEAGHSWNKVYIRFPIVGSFIFLMLNEQTLMQEPKTTNSYQKQHWVHPDDHSLVCWSRGQQLHPCMCFSGRILGKPRQTTQERPHHVSYIYTH